MTIRQLTLHLCLSSLIWKRSVVEGTCQKRKKERRKKKKGEKDRNGDRLMLTEGPETWEVNSL